MRVPGRCLVGGKERLDARLARLAEGGSGGEQAAMKTFEAVPAEVAAMAVGVARAAMEYATDYATQRVQFGKPDRAEPGRRVHARGHAGRGRRGPAADLAGGLDGAAWPQFEHAEGSMSKLVAGETAVGSPSRPSRSSAGTATPGTTRSSAGTAMPKIFTIFEGTSEIQRMIIGRAITGLPVR